MKYVWVCYQVYWNYYDEFETVVEIFDSKEKAEMWLSAGAQATTTDYRRFERVEVT